VRVLYRLVIVVLLVVGCNGKQPKKKPEKTKIQRQANASKLPISHSDLRELVKTLDEASRRSYKCDHKFTLTRRFLSARKLNVEKTLRWLGEQGAGCDCEIMFNVEQNWGDKVGFRSKE
jgi:hypothetical protein